MADMIKLPFTENISGIYNCEIQLPSGNYKVLTVIDSLGTFTTYIAGNRTGDSFDSLDEAIAFLQSEAARMSGKVAPHPNIHATTNYVRNTKNIAATNRNNRWIVAIAMCFLCVMFVVWWGIVTKKVENSTDVARPNHVGDTNNDDMIALPATSSPKRDQDVLDIPINVQRNERTTRSLTLRELLSD